MDMRCARWMSTLLAAVALTAAAEPAAAKILPETAAVGLFDEACLKPGNEAAIRARMAADSAWSKSGIDPKLTIGGRNDPKTWDAWSRMLDGKEVKLVLGKPTKRPSELICVLLVPDVQNMLPHLDAFQDATKAAGLKGFNTDLPHLYRTKGRLASGLKAQSDLYSRSPFLPGQRAMHMVLYFSDKAARPQ